MASTDGSDPRRGPDGKFKKGNPGRPKGSKNRITLLKLMAEEEFRDNNDSKIRKVLNKIVDAALEGDLDCQKLIWQSVMSKGGIQERSEAKEKVSIEIKAHEANVVKEPAHAPKTGDQDGSKAVH